MNQALLPDLATLRYPSKNDPEVAGHFERVIQGQKISSVLDYARNNQKAVMITGEAGTGKSTTAEYYAAIRNLPICVVECSSGIDSTMTQGKFVPTGTGKELMWRYSSMATAIQQPAVILLNEATRMPAKANALFLRVLAERELIIDTHHNEVIKVHDECLFIADANIGYRGTMSPDQAFMDRHAVKVEFEYDEVLERNFIPSDSLLELAKSMRQLARNEGKFTTPISTRLLKEFVATARGLSFRFAVYNFAQNFALDERQSVSMLLATYAENIANELNVELADYEV